MGSPQKAGPGRPRHPATELVAAMLAEGAAVHGIQKALWRRGIHITRRAIMRIRDGTRQASASLLAPGETRLAVKVKCPGCGGLIDVDPCRLCRARAYLARRRQLADKLAARKGQGGA